MSEPADYVVRCGESGFDVKFHGLTDVRIADGALVLVRDDNLVQIYASGVWKGIRPVGAKP